MRRQHANRSGVEREIDRLRQDRPLSADVAARAKEIAADLAEDDVRRTLAHATFEPDPPEPRRHPMAIALAAPKVELIPLGYVLESASNPRKTFSGIEELAEDLKLHGILQPVLLREKGDKYELVFGARRFRAAKLAGLPYVPAFIRELTDEEALEIQLVENSKRADIHPLEEADGYHVLHEKYGHSVDEIAAKVGKSRSAVYERIKLCALGPSAREAFLAEKLSASTALLIARIPDHELQAKAVKSVVHGYGGDPMTYREAVEHVQSHYMLHLKDAPFSTTDADLVPSAGACSACPKRTGNQRELFPDVKSPDVCTDPSCYQAKREAVWKLKVEKAKETGQRVIDGKEAKKLFPYTGTTLAPGSGLEKLEHEVWVNGKHKTVKALLGKEAPPTVLARTPDGDVVELVPVSAVQKKIREVEPTPSTTRYSHSDSNSQQEKKYQTRRKVVAAAMPVIVEKAGKNVAGLWPFLAEAIFHGGYHSAISDVARRRGFTKDEKKQKQPGDLLRASVPKMNDEQLRGLVVEVVATADAAGGSWSYSYSELFTEACKTFGIDLKKLEAQARKAAPAKKAAKK